MGKKGLEAFTLQEERNYDLKLCSNPSVWQHIVYEVVCQSPQ